MGESPPQEKTPLLSNPYVRCRELGDQSTASKERKVTFPNLPKVELHFFEGDRQISGVDQEIFISGIKEEIKPMVKMLKPTTLIEAFEIAEWQEQSLALNRRYTRNTRNWEPGENSKSSSVSSVTNTGGKTSEVVGQRKKEQSFVFQMWGEVYPGHQCKYGYLNFILEGDEEPEFLDAIGEHDEYTGHLGQSVDVSLHALTTSVKRKTLRLQGVLEGQTVSILVDTGSTNSFLNAILLKTMELRIAKMTPLRATIADGTTISSELFCPSVTWSIQGYNFSFPLVIMELGMWDMILGVDWMVQYSPITFDFKQLLVRVSEEGGEMVLEGAAKQPSMKLIRGKAVKKFMQQKHKTLTSICSASENSNSDGVSPLPSEISELLHEFSDVFAEPTQLPPERAHDHTIPLKPGAQPFKLRPYRYPHSQKIEIENQVSSMLQTGIIKPSTSPFSSPVLVVKKKEDLQYYANHLRTMLKILRSHQLYAKMSKCMFAQLRVEYLGHVISYNGVEMDAAKVECIRAWVLRRFVQGYGQICKPLTELLRKDSFCWNESAVKAFQKLKDIMSTTLVLRMPDFSKPFVVETDACSKGIGAVLMQEGQPIAYLNKALSPKNLGLSIYEKDLLAVVIAVTKWKHYLLGYHFIIRTDHQSLRFLLEQKLNTPLQHKCLTKLLGLDYEFQYKKGAENKAADALSRKGFQEEDFAGVACAIT
ncbi:uncharacterized protein [Coffea arabica]|uniref:Reverse transcriptase/retrotransposon-derived protein RNase H-like domain-containing protein n=1 Tax=Coffea arabica TaxID=13443 RepID=A0ABM4UEW2_COFAR